MDVSQPSGRPEAAKQESARMARGVLTVAALLSVTAGVGLAAAAIIRNPTLEGVAGGVAARL